MTLPPARMTRAGLLVALFCLGAAWSAGAFAAKPFCGDGKCSGGETAATCSADCGSTPLPFCGDGTCDADETLESCPEDCLVTPPGNCNFDGICNIGEDCTSCSDCPGKTDGKPKNRFCCGLDTCDTGLCGANACSASNPVCGNGVEEYGEECDDGNTAPGDGCDANCRLEASGDPVPSNQFNVGDSIGEGEAADGTLGEPHHEVVWSTGYAAGDIVDSLNERFEATDSAAYTENNATRDPAINQAVSGAIMQDFAAQSLAVAGQMANVPPGTAGMVTVLLGNNDVCADTVAGMTDPDQFEAQYRAGLDVLASEPFADTVNLLVSGIPSIYWLWNAKRNDFMCRVFIWPFVPCQNLLSGASDDCASAASREDPDNVYPGDGPNCQRRKAFHARIRDEFNPILRDVLAEYRGAGLLPNAEYVDIMDVRFGSSHVNGGDCFHPSTAGHALMAEQQWCRSRWGQGDPACSP